MSQGRPETKADAEPADSRAERDRFEALADKIRQESHLPSQDDQSWREREAIRLSAYDRGYIPPQGNQSWREREALLFVPAQENDTADVERDREPPLSVLPPVSTTKGGQGGILLAFLLVAAIALGIVALAHPEILTTSFWRTAGGGNNPAPETASAPAHTTPVSTPPIQQPSLSPPAPALDLRGTPDPTPPAEAATPAPPAPEPAPVQIIDAAAPPKPASATRAAPRNDADTGGFYAKVPGPDGTLQDKFFPSQGKSGKGKSGPIKSDKAPAVPPLSRARGPLDQSTVDKGAGGFYARVPGPDGTLEYKYFPSKPPR